MLEQSLIAFIFFNSSKILGIFSISFTQKINLEVPLNISCIDCTSSVNE